MDWDPLHPRLERASHPAVAVAPLRGLPMLQDLEIVEVAPEMRISDNSESHVSIFFES